MQSPRERAFHYRARDTFDCSARGIRAGHDWIKGFLVRRGKKSKEACQLAGGRRGGPGERGSSRIEGHFMLENAQWSTPWRESGTPFGLHPVTSIQIRTGWPRRCGPALFTITRFITTPKTHRMLSPRD